MKKKSNMKEFLQFFQRKIEFILKNALTNRGKRVILSNTETSRRDGRVDEGATLEMWCGATHRGFESLSLRHFFCQKMAERSRKASLHAFMPIKALHLKPQVFFTSSPKPEALLVKSFASLSCEDVPLTLHL